MTSQRALRQHRFDDRNAAHEMLTLSTQREQLRAELRDALGQRDRAHAAELIARIKVVDLAYNRAAARRSAARRHLINHAQEVRAHAP